MTTKTTITSPYFYGYKLSQESLDHGFVSWADYFRNFDIVLCNDLPAYLAEKDDMLEVVNGSELIYYYDGEEVTEEEIEELGKTVEDLEIYERHCDVFQYYIISDQCYEAIKYDMPDQLVYYCEALNIYILGVTHYGTSWTMVFTDLKIELDEEVK